MKTALKQMEEDLETGLLFSNVCIPLLHCLLLQQAEKLTNDSLSVRDPKVQNSTDFQSELVSRCLLLIYKT